jgi:hypothetical protein
LVGHAHAPFAAALALAQHVHVRLQPLVWLCFTDICVAKISAGWMLKPKDGDVWFAAASAVVVAEAAGEWLPVDAAAMAALLGAGSAAIDPFAAGEEAAGAAGSALAGYALAGSAVAMADSSWTEVQGDDGRR